MFSRMGLRGCPYNERTGKHPEGGRHGQQIWSFLAGGLAGAVVALLYAPRSGQETRAMVTDKMSAAWGEAQELALRPAPTCSTRIRMPRPRVRKSCRTWRQGSRAVRPGHAARAGSRRQHQAGVLAEERRASRQDRSGAPAHRSQVAKNAEQAHDAVSDTIPVAADTAHEAVDKAEDKAQSAPMP